MSYMLLLNTLIILFMLAHEKSERVGIENDLKTKIASLEELNEKK